MRQLLLLSPTVSVVLLGLAVLPLYNSTRTTCGFPWDTIVPPHERDTTEKYYNLLSGYENISNFDIRSTDVVDGFEIICQNILYRIIDSCPLEEYEEMKEYEEMREYEDPYTTVVKPSMSLQEVFIFISNQFQLKLANTSDSCILDRKEQHQVHVPYSYRVENLFDELNRFLKELIRFKEGSDLKNEDRLKKRVINLLRFKAEGPHSLQLRDIYALVRLQLQKPKNERKMLLQMALTKYITEHVTNEAIDILACNIKKLDENVFLQSLDVSKIEFHSSVEKVKSDNHLIIEQHGMSPYIELANALVEELELINIHDVTYNFYSIIMTAMQLTKEIDWDGNTQKIIYASHILDTLIDGIFCHKWPSIEKNMLQMFENLKYDINDDVTEDPPEALISFLQSAHRRFFRHPLYSLGRYQIAWIEDLFTLQGQDMMSFPMTLYLKRNKGVMNELFNHKIKFLDMKSSLGAVLERIHDNINAFNYYNLKDLSSHLFKNISLSKQDRDVIFEPIDQVLDVILNISCPLLRSPECDCECVLFKFEF